MGDQVEETCPLCAEEMDSTDRQLKPCKCGYELCVWCWHHIMDMAEKDETEGRCPACRTPYDKEKIVGMTSNSGRFITDNRLEKKMKAQKVKSKAYEGRKQFGSLRVIQRNLAYIVGIPVALANQDILQRKEYFGQYGRILKISISRTSTTSIHHVPNSTCSVYVTFTKEDEAISCIEAADGFILDGKSLRACFGTTKYCHSWLRNVPCSNPECLYLHEVGSKEDSFTKDVIITAYTRFQNNTGSANNLQFRSGSTLPPPTNECCSNRSMPHAKPIAENGNNLHNVGEGSPCNNKPAALPSSAVLRRLNTDGQFSTSVVHTKQKTLSSTATSTADRSRPCDNTGKRPIPSKQKQTEQQFQNKPDIDLSTDIMDRHPQLDTVALKGASASTDGSGTLQNAVSDKIFNKSFDRNRNSSDSEESVSFSNDKGYTFMKSDGYAGIDQSHAREVVSLPFDDHIFKIRSKEHWQNVTECSGDHKEPVLPPSLSDKLDILRVSSNHPECPSGLVNDSYRDITDDSSKSFSYQCSNSAHAMTCSAAVHPINPLDSESPVSNPDILNENKLNDSCSDSIVNDEKTETCSKNCIESSIISNILSMDFDVADDSLTPPHDLFNFFCKNDKREGPIQASNSLKVNGMNQSRFSFARDEGESSGVHSLVNDQPVLQSSVGCRSARFGVQAGVGSSNGSDFLIRSDHVLPPNKHFVARPFIAPPPGFSAVQFTTGAPPPGFITCEPVSTAATCHVEDITLLDPAILAVGKGGFLFDHQQRHLSIPRDSFQHHLCDPPVRPDPWAHCDIPAPHWPHHPHHWDVPAWPQHP